MCVRAQDPERRMEEQGLQRDHPSWEVISRFLSFCLSLSVWRVHTSYSKNLSKKNKNKKQNTTLMEKKKKQTLNEIRNCICITSEILPPSPHCISRAGHRERKPWGTGPVWRLLTRSDLVEGDGLRGTAPQRHAHPLEQLLPREEVLVSGEHLGEAQRGVSPRSNGHLQEVEMAW